MVEKYWIVWAFNTVLLKYEIHVLIEQPLHKQFHIHVKPLKDALFLLQVLSNQSIELQDYLFMTQLLLHWCVNHFSRK